ncbi:MAG: hypothetical protein ACPGLY_16940 [Rubripirellula sp.]
MTRKETVPARKQDAERRLLELELYQVRREADLARLEARAAEIERMIHQLAFSDATCAVGLPPAIEEYGIEQPVRLPDGLRRLDQHADADLAMRASGAESQSELKSKKQARTVTGTRAKQSLPESATQRGKQRGETEKTVRKRGELGGIVKKLGTVEQNDAGDRKPRMNLKNQAGASVADVTARANRSSRKPETQATVFPASAVAETKKVKCESVTVGGLLPVDSSGRAVLAEVNSHRRRFRLPFMPRTIATEAAAGRTVARRPALAASVIAHLVLLICLGLAGIKLKRPKDQVQFTASVATGENSPLESLSIETAEPTVTDQLMQAVEPEFGDLEQSALNSIDLTPEVNQTPGKPVEGLMMSGNEANQAMLHDPATAEKIEFCGIEGGGNHFVYLVDSSKSMGQAFPLARAELLRSIEALKSDQRFYVIFFDAQSDYMRIADRGIDEVFSVSATAENKSALGDWAMGVEMDVGQAPYESLRFAFKLKPDVIFLLSDGEFPEGIEALIATANQAENLFGERQHCSIVHTIGFHSQKGGARMRRIAQQNGGQYRHIPKP